MIDKYRPDPIDAGAIEPTDNALADVGGDLQGALIRFMGGMLGEWRGLLADAEKKYEAAHWKPQGEREQVKGLLEYTRWIVSAFERLGENGPPKHDHLTPADFTWHDVTAEWRRDETAGRALMDQIKGAARDELRTGRTAATAIEGYMPRPGERAEFLAVRESLADGLKPANGAEWLLIDAMSQATIQHRRWLHKAAFSDTMEARHLDRDARTRGEWLPPRIGDTEYVDRALATADRFMKSFLRLLKAYRDQRRVLGTLVVAGGQVNIAAEGGQQVVATRTVRGADRPKNVKWSRRRLRPTG